MKKIPVAILALEDVGCGRNMEVYYWSLMSSSFLEPIMIYTNKLSSQRAPVFITRKILCEISPVDCFPDDSLVKKKTFRLYDSWFNELEPYIASVRHFLGEETIWVLDMIIPELEKMLGKYTVQVFHGHLFEIGGGTYFDEWGKKSFDKYWLIFITGPLMAKKIQDAYHSQSIQGKTIQSGRLLNFYLDDLQFLKKNYLEKIGLNSNNKTLCYAPSWESKKIWPIGSFEKDADQLRTFCTWAKKRHLNVILRPHHLAVQHYQVDEKMKQIAREFKGTVYLENTRQYSYQGPKNTLLVSDILITDLSSIAIDFMALKKPSIFFYPDNKSSLWGTLPLISEVQHYSYTVTDFASLYKKLDSLLNKKEPKEILRQREKVVGSIFAHSGSEAVLIFKDQLEKKALQSIKGSRLGFFKKSSTRYQSIEKLNLKLKNEVRY